MKKTPKQPLINSPSLLTEASIPPPVAELSERQRLFQVLDRVDAVCGGEDIDALAANMLDLILEVVGAESATYLRYDAETDELEVQCVRGDPESEYLVGLRIKRQISLVGKPEPGNNPIVIGDLASDPRWLRVVNPAKVTGWSNAILLPIETRQKVLGMIQIYNFRLAEMDALRFLSGRLAIELDRLQALHAERKANRRLHELLGIVGHLSGIMDRATLLNSVTEAACTLVDADRSSIFIIDTAGDGASFHTSYQADGHSRYKEQRHPAPELTNPGEGSRLGAAQTGNAASDSNYFSRSVITIPIPAVVGAGGSMNAQKTSLGELMTFAGGKMRFQKDDLGLLEILAEQASVFLKVADLYDSTAELFVGSITALVAAIDAKDPYTQGHSQRVSDYSVLIGRELGLSESDLSNLRIGSLFHDVGKIGLPDSILLSETTLSSDEWQIVRRHPLTGMNILNKVQILAPSLPAVLEHHERLDGSGYPSGLIGDQISLFGRIVAVADVFDAMTSDRPYRKALSVEQVLKHLRLHAGTQFDGNCVAALERIATQETDPV